MASSFAKRSNSSRLSGWLAPDEKRGLANAYRPTMRMAYELCLATAGKQVDWIHEVKHDG